MRHEAGQQNLGQVAELNPDRDFGFLLTKEGGLLYFHRNSMLAGDFDALSCGTRSITSRTSATPAARDQGAGKKRERRGNGTATTS